jgi:hypothetical protein
MNARHLLLSLSLLLATTAQATTEAPANQPPTTQLKIVGEGKMSYLFWDIYNLKLYTATGNYEGLIKDTALEFNYLRDIKSIELVNETENQWRELKLDVHPEEAKWLAQLKTLWPDITEGDQLIFYINDKGYSEFYYNGKYTGVIESVEFSDRFKQIWLSEDTTAPKVRQKLLTTASK